MAFEGEEVFAGPEDRFDPLADRREVRTAPCSSCGGDAGSWRRAGRPGLKLAAGVALVADHDLTAGESAALQQHQPDLALVDLRGAQLQGAGGAVRAKIACSRNPQKYRECVAHQP